MAPPLQHRASAQLARIPVATRARSRLTRGTPIGVRPCLRPGCHVDATNSLLTIDAMLAESFADYIREGEPLKISESPVYADTFSECTT
jgi:hypothetical protein